ncbi:tyrosine-protein kinase family protein [Metallosphaera javensis (ex Sakai et al. 2022)]|uniref:tyrosine-protein kinase family protein n=1 Tax=Metallosphaera javensis (ex Sakai et al. 2022) TaxID=2775498 RepID=UPI00258BB66C|nr:MAG: iron-sulfur cluster carrier protein [Metallosphaera javensis (ex Sakai et al. 2022)]
MRLSIRSSKGGVGKSTIAISLAKTFAYEGHHVLLMDRDIVGYASYLAGIRGPGLVTSLAEGKDVNVIREFRLGKGSITVLKYFGDGPRYKLDLERIHRDKDLMNVGWKYYNEFLARKKYSYFIVDNAPMVMPNDEINRYEHMQFKSLFPDIPIKYLVVSDSLAQTIEDNVKYAKVLSSLNQEILSFIINMIRPQDLLSYENIVRRVMTELRCGIGVLIPFNEELFQFSGDIEEFPVPQQVKELAKRIRAGEQGIIS